MFEEKRKRKAKQGKGKGKKNKSEEERKPLYRWHEIAAVILVLVSVSLPGGREECMRSRPTGTT